MLLKKEKKHGNLRYNRHKKDFSGASDLRLYRLDKLMTIDPPHLTSRLFSSIRTRLEEQLLAGLQGVNLLLRFYAP